MPRSRDIAPPGYERLLGNHTEAVGLATLAAPLVEALREGSFYEYGAHHPRSRILSGRGVAYAVALPDETTRVVIRRSRHGGLLAPLTGERFLGRTRAPRELATALRLARLGVPTPELVAYATYPAGALTRRADVVTREVPNSLDMAAAIGAAATLEERQTILAAAARLIALLTAAGARHPDLNIKNILIAPDENGEPEALVLDVDRIWFDAPGARRVTTRNLQRLMRSARKWRRLHALPLREPDLLWLTAAVEDYLLPSDRP
jgi:3-deoxy-D-manno-octulosonic acid kinase